MAHFDIIGNKSSVGSAYTSKEERNDGYLANLIHGITKELLEQNLVPLLYTDYNYTPSNTAYKNARNHVTFRYTCSKTNSIL